MKLSTITGCLISRSKNHIGVTPYLSTKSDDRVITITEQQAALFSRCSRYDLISCEVGTEGEESKLEGTVLITRNLVEKTHIISSMIASVRQKGRLLVSPSKLVGLYHHIESNLLNVELPTVSQLLSYKANLYNSGHKRSVISSISSALTGPELSSVLRGWYTTNDIRLLECVGISKEEIRESYMRPDILYSLYMENPMLVYCVPLEKAIVACKLLDINVNVYRRAAEALRELAENVVTWNHSCVTCNSFYRKHNLSDTSIQQLLERAVVPDTCDKERVLYLRELRDMEVYVASHLHSIFTANLPEVGSKRPESEDELKYDREQDKAIEQALKSNISIINGAAGTGKTTIVKKIIARLKLNGVPFACTSFTGCATARISQCCNVEAEDMDLMIVKSDTYNFSHLIIDEFSMTSIKLMYLFLQAFPGPYRITIIGDINQLEPIGPGSVLRQMIKSNCIPVTTLRTIHRVKDRHGVVDRIIENSKRIAYWEDKPFSFIEGDNFEVREGTMRTLTLELQDMHKRGVPTSDFTVMSPRKIPVPIINRTVQLLYNWQTKRCIQKAGKWTVQDRGLPPSKEEMSIGCLVYHIDDRVMILKNKSNKDDDVKMFNGQEGVITNIVSQGIEVAIQYGPTMIFPFYSKEGEPNVSFITLCYAVTVHKMQGKQTKKAIYFLDKYSSFITRNMTYTAITRAEEEVLLIGNRESFNKSVNNVPREKREYLYWRLRERLPEDFIPVKDDRMAEELLERQRLNNIGAAEENDDSGGYDDDDDDY